MHPLAGTPFAFWMTSYMAWANLMAQPMPLRPAKRR